MPLALAERVAARLATIDGVVAVVLGGSRARGDAGPDSDVDLGLYYEPARPLDLSALRRLARELDDRGAADAVTEPGEWGPWINGGAWLQIEGQRVDWLYKDLDHIRYAVAECRAGRPACFHQIGHPDGFHTHVYLAEMHYCRVLDDRGGVLTKLKAETTPYPPALKRALIERFLFDAEFWLTVGRKSTGRGDVFHVAGCLFRCAAALVQVLFALNERYWMNEKRAVAMVEGFALRPDGFAATVSAVLSQAGDTPAEQAANVDRLTALAHRVRQMAGRTAP